MSFESRRGINLEADFYKVKVDKTGFVDGLGYVNDPDNQDFLEKLKNGFVEVVKDESGQITEVIFTKKYLQDKQVDRERIMKNKSIFADKLITEFAEEPIQQKEGIKQELQKFLSENDPNKIFELKKITKDYVSAGIHKCLLFRKDKSETISIVGDMDKIKKVILSHRDNGFSASKTDESEISNKEANA